MLGLIDWSLGFISWINHMNMHMNINMHWCIGVGHDMVYDHDEYAWLMP